MSVSATKSDLPHGHPFVFVDRVLEVEAGKRAVGIKNITQNEDALRGHFPNQPITPGVHIVEALAQIAGIALNAGKPASDAAQTGLIAIRDMKFKKKVEPGDQLLLTATLTANLGPLAQFVVKAERGKELIAEGELVMGKLQG